LTLFNELLGDEVFKQLLKLASALALHDVIFVEELVTKLIETLRFLEAAPY
jgi:hypothetical protein